MDSHGIDYTVRLVDIESLDPYLEAKKRELRRPLKAEGRLNEFVFGVSETLWTSHAATLGVGVAIAACEVALAAQRLPRREPMAIG